jgi:hypothetical protein
MQFARAFVAEKSQGIFATGYDLLQPVEILYENFRGRNPPRGAKSCRLLSYFSIAYMAFEAINFVLDAEFLALQIGDRISIRQGTPILFIDGAV